MWRREVANQSPLKLNPIFHCLDTFEGMPDNQEGKVNFQKNTFQCELEDVRKRINDDNPRDVEIKYYKGLFKDKGEELKYNLRGRNISIANIDCDLMDSTVDALNII